MSKKNDAIGSGLLPEDDIKNDASSVQTDAIDAPNLMQENAQIDETNVEPVDNNERVFVEITDNYAVQSEQKPFFTKVKQGATAALNKTIEFFGTGRGKRLLVVLCVAVLVIGAIVVYGIATKMSVNAVFSSKVEAFVFQTTDDGGVDAGVGLNKEYDLSKFATGKNSEAPKEFYQKITFRGNPNGGDKSLVRLAFSTFGSKEVALSMTLTITAPNIATPIVLTGDIWLYKDAQCNQYWYLNKTLTDISEDTIFEFKFNNTASPISFSFFNMLFLTN